MRSREIGTADSGALATEGGRPDPGFLAASPVPLGTSPPTGGATRESRGTTQAPCRPTEPRPSSPGGQTGLQGRLLSRVWHRDGLPEMTSHGRSLGEHSV